MYQPRLHRVDDLQRQHAFLRQRPLGLLVTSGPGGLMANPVPFVLDEAAGPRGTLRAHVARANPQWREADGAREALVVFQTPGAYVSPSWYATKRQSGKVVPTWNYVCVQARGPLRAIDDRDWLRRQIDALTRGQEAGREAPWDAADAPEDFIDDMIGAVIGLELPIASLDGKWKVSQNRAEADRLGVIDGLRAEGGDAANEMADLVEQAMRL